MALVNMFVGMRSGRCDLKTDPPHLQDGVLWEEASQEHGTTDGELQSFSSVPRGSEPAGPTTFERILRLYYLAWRITAAVCDPESSRAFEDFVRSSTMRRSSKDLYTPRFLIVLMLLGWLIFYWQAMSGEGRSLDEALSSNHFSGTQVIVLIIVSDRMLYTWYRSDLYSESRVPQAGTEEDSSSSFAGEQGELSGNPAAPTFGGPAAESSAQGDPRQMRVFVRMLHQALLVTHICILHAVFMLRWLTVSTPLEICLSLSLLRARHTKLVTFYVLYMLYIVLSSLQLRYDVHIVRGGMRFTKSTDFFTKMCFRVYSALPFLHELRVLTDWTATLTALDFFMWMKLEDAQHNLYRVRADMEIRALIPPGHKRPAFEKLYLGGLLLFLLLFLLIGPILYFSSLNSLSRRPNPVIYGELSVSLEIASQGTANPWVRSLNLYKAQAQMIEPVDSYRRGETWQKVSFPTSSDSFWLISPSARDSVARLLKEENVKATVKLSFIFDRQATAVKATAVDLSQSLSNETVRQFAQVLSAGASGDEKTVITVDSTFGPNKRLTSGSKALNLEGLAARRKDRNPVRLEFEEHGSLPHWSVMTGEDDSNWFRVACILSSDDIAAEGSSVHSLYVGVVLTIGNFLRLIFKDSSKRVIYEEVPDTDLLLDLCDGIYIARIQGDLDTEYKLYYELIRVYRSPELLARVSQPKALSRDLQTKGTMPTESQRAPGMQRLKSDNALGEPPQPRQRAVRERAEH